MAYNEQLVEFWKNNNFKDIKHPSSEFPEGWDARDELVSIVGNDSVNEVGCGYGRLVAKFQPSQYHGFDINPACTERAKNENPTFNFTAVEAGEELPPSDWVMYYTVAVHVDDNDIGGFLESTTKNCNKVLIAEMLGRDRWRRRAVKFRFAFNRDESEYTEIMDSLGFKLLKHHSKPYAKLRGEPFGFLQYVRK